MDRFDRNAGVRSVRKGPFTRGNDLRWVPNHREERQFNAQLGCGPLPHLVHPEDPRTLMTICCSWSCSLNHSRSTGSSFNFFYRAGHECGCFGAGIHGANRDRVEKLFVEVHYPLRLVETARVCVSWRDLGLWDVKPQSLQRPCYGTGTAPPRSGDKD